MYNVTVNPTGGYFPENACLQSDILRDHSDTAHKFHVFYKHAWLLSAPLVYRFNTSSLAFKKSATYLYLQIMLYIALQGKIT